jgi:hypothetical protein
VPATVASVDTRCSAVIHTTTGSSAAAPALDTGTVTLEGTAANTPSRVVTASTPAATVEATTLATTVSVPVYAVLVVPTPVDCLEDTTRTADAHAVKTVTASHFEAHVPAVAEGESVIEDATETTRAKTFLMTSLPHSPP